MNKEEYLRFVEEIKNSGKIEINDFENDKIFEGCMPIEVIAERGVDTLAFGPMKPVGLIDPATDRQPYAVIQLRTGKHQQIDVQHGRFSDKNEME